MFYIDIQTPKKEKSIISNFYKLVLSFSKGLLSLVNSLVPTLYPDELISFRQDKSLFSYCSLIDISMSLSHGNNLSSLTIPSNVPLSSQNSILFYPIYALHIQAF